MVKVDRKKCIGCGLCVSVVPEVFELDSEGKSIVKDAKACKDNMKKCKEAAEGCPVNAISIS